jgi:excisionase family DNA binding protein
MLRKQGFASLEYYSVSAVAQCLGVSERTAHTLIHNEVDGIPFHRIGKKLIRVKKADLDAWMQRRRIGESLSETIVRELCGS